MPSLPISHHRQLRQADCLAACAAMVLDYLEKLNVSVLIEQGNFSALKTCCERGLPSIVFVNTGELPYWNEATNHAVVVAGIEDDTILLFDPAFDTEKLLSIAEFELAWLEMDQFYAMISLK